MDSSLVKAGQIIPLRYENRDLKAIVIDPNGLGPGKPSIGLGIRGMDRLIGIPRNTLSSRVSQIDGINQLKLPSGNAFRVSQILAEDNNEYLLIEASDWVSIAKDWAKDPGKLRKPARDGLIDFLGWYAAQGIYAQAYTIIRKVYTSEDSKAIQNWILSRETGKPYRIEWGFEVTDKDPRKRYGYWTNYVYRGLFGMDAAEMKAHWESPVQGSRQIARNYIPESIGLEAVAYCEKMVALLDFDDVQEAHDTAIQLTKTKFRGQLH
jgi:hypothetical protein